VKLRELVTKGCVDVLQLDAALVGGIGGLRRTALVAKQHNIMFTPPHLDQRHGRKQH
jgi:L-alanine-DL-glutamate epimerase-like enolase superfamily enzyme